MIFKILYELTNYPFNCPRSLQKLSPKSFSSFFQHISQHKLEAFLFHFIQCQKCQKKLTKNQQTKLTKVWQQKKFISQALKKHSQKLSSLFKTHKIKAFLPKDLTWLPIYSNHNLYQSWTDIDILVVKKDLNKTLALLQTHNYQIKKTYEEYFRLTNYHWKEYLLKNKNIKLDIQTTFGQNTLNRLHHPSPANYTKLLTQTLKNTKPGLHCPPKSFQLLYLTIHFLFQDKLFGLKNANDIKNLTKTLTLQELQQSLELATEHNLKKPFLFTLLLTENLFNKKIIPQDFAPKLPKSHILLSSLSLPSSIQKISPKKKLPNSLKKSWTYFITNLALL